MENISELQDLAKRVDHILKEELGKEKINYDLAEARIYSAKTVGVQGDERTYGHPAEITLFYKKDFVWNTEFLQRLSIRITNEIKGVNKVVYLTGFK